MWNDANLWLSVNQKAMRLFGIETATYFALIAHIVPRVIAKQTADENGYFTINRRYVEEQIGLSCEKQYNCDSILQRNGILAAAPESRDKISIDNKLWIGLLAEEDPNKLAEVQRLSNLPKFIRERDASNARALIRAEEKTRKAEQAELERIQKEEKKQKAAEAKAAKEHGIRVTMKNIAATQAVATTDDLVAALGNWVDSIYDAKNFLTKAAIEIFCAKIAEFSTDSTVRKELVDIAAARSYKDATFVFDVYKRSHGNTPTKVAQPQKITTANNVDTSVSF